MANNEQLEILRKGAKAWNDWREKNPKPTASLQGANLFGVDLRGAKLQGTNLYGADLGDANLEGADLGGANLRGARLDNANLRRTCLSGADLGGANLEDADLEGAKLEGADLQGAKLGGGVTVSVRQATIYIERYPVVVFDHHMKIGCQLHSLDDWGTFSADQIEKMSNQETAKAWELWKPAIMAFAREHERVAIARQAMQGETQAT